ncbi:MAG: hypothetical protein V3U29_02705 [Phycisphaeraceae bacterium]
MPSEAAEAELTIWTDAQRVARVTEVLDRLGSSVEPIGVGGPRTAPINELAGHLGCPQEDDFRKLLLDHPAAFVLLSTWRGVSREDIQTAIGQGSVIVALEPIAVIGDAVRLAKARTGAAATTGITAVGCNSGTAGAASAAPAAAPPSGRIVVMPAFTESPGWTSAADPAELLGAPHVISFSSSGGVDDCSLFGRLFDAWRVVLRLSDLPESIDATLSGPLGEVPEDLRGLTGHLAAHARMPHGGAALVQVSDRAGPHRRGLRVISEQAQWDVDDLGYQLHDASGKLLDDHQPQQATIGFADLIVRHWTRLGKRITSSTADEPAGADDADVLACCLASRLSARTGQGESPRKLLEMQGL